jgi:hypothetical protein
MAALVMALQVALFPVFSNGLGMGKLSGFVAACIWIVAKPELVYNREAYYAALLIAVTCWLYRRHLNSKSHCEVWVVWVLGCLMGLLILMIPTFGLVLASWIGWDIWRSKWAFLWRKALPLVLLPAIIICLFSRIGG